MLLKLDPKVQALIDVKWKPITHVKCVEESLVLKLYLEY